jgi:DNA-binding beta-propeller fold protein YncE
MKHLGIDGSRICRLGFTVLVVALAAACSSAANHGGSAAVPAVSQPGTQLALASAPDGQTAAGGSVVLGGSPGTPAANPLTGTVYVPIQCTTSFCSPNTPGHVVDVINAASCNAETGSGCRVVATAGVGSSPLAAAVDEQTDTIYVTNGDDGTVSVLNGAQCNAKVTRGCDTPVATIKAGGFLVAAAFNPDTGTLYVASPNGDVFVIDAAGCNAVTTRGCTQPVRKVTDNQGPQALDVDMATDTVYAANAGSGNGDTVSVIDGATCNGTDGSGCGKAPRTITVGSGAWWVAVDQASDTVYVANNNDGTVSVIDGARCNASVTSGCSSTPPTVTTGANPSFVAVDPSSGTVFAVNQGDNTLSAINTGTCNGTVTWGCQHRAPNEQASPNQDPGYNPFPNALALIPQTGSAYVVNVGGASVLSVVNVSRCNAADITGCRTEAPSVPAHEYTISTDPATGTIYASNSNLPRIDVLNGATCHAGNLAGCVPVAEIPMGHPLANVGTVDDATHTLYAADPDAGTVAVINTATCNADNTTGCASKPTAIKIGALPNAPVINTATHTMYVAYGSAGNKIAVVNAATCNAARTSGCGQTPAVVKVAAGTAVLAVSAATDTIYAPNAGSSFDGDTMSVINGATCNGTNHSGCSHVAATVTVGSGPFGVTVDDRTHTVYVVNNADGDAPGTVSVINGATCNGTDTSGCRRHFPTMATGRSPGLAALNPATGIVYVTEFSSAGVSILDGSRCNASVTSGCSASPREQAVGSQPFGLAIDQNTSTVYVTDTFQDGSLSILSAIRPWPQCPGAV